MWRKRSEEGRVIALRLAAYQSLLGNIPPLGSGVTLEITIQATPADGDLDNFITGICDGLQAANPKVLSWLDLAPWQALPDEIKPDRPVALRDDRDVSRIIAQRTPSEGAPRYEVRISW